MDIAIALVTAAMLVVGGIFTFLAAVGIFRLPDVYTRMHAASKAGTVGSGLMLIAAGLHSLELATVTRAFAGFVFFILTAPIAAHLVARAAHQAGYRLSRHAVLDDMREHNRQRSPK